MTTISALELSLYELRSLVLEAFKIENQTQYLSVCGQVANVVL